ncbi:MAG: glycosyltransferase [Solirubrobacteraceae bacterium]
MIGIHPPEGVTADQVRVLYEKLLGREAAAAETELHAPATLGELLRTLLDSPEFAGRALGLVPPETAHANIWAAGLEPFHPPPGTLSPDDAVEVGRDGFLLLNDGTNAPLEQFLGRYELADDWAQRWTEALELRSRQAAELGVALAWLMVPDKTVVHADLRVGAPAPGRRPVHRLIDEVGVPLIYPVDRLRALGDAAFLRTDTHLTSRGTRVLAATVTEAFGAPAPPAHDDHPFEHQMIIGDIGSAFRPPMVELVCVHGDLPGRTLVDTQWEIVASGSHFGTRLVVRNDAAPDPRTCVIFGDSFSFTGQLPGGRTHQGMAWWLARVFRELHFAWVPFGWDSAYLKAVGPALVLSEGAERFAVRSPQPDTDTALFARQVIAQVATDPWHAREADRSPVAAAPGGDVTAEEIGALYEHLLGRRARGEEIAVHASAASFAALVDIVLASDEFAVRLIERVNRHGAAPNVWSPELATYAPPAGSLSADRTAEVGQHGVLLPGPRAAGLRSQLAGGECPPDDWLDAWHRALTSRTEASAEVWAHFAWLVVPDKLVCETQAQVAPLDLGGRPVQHLLDPAATAVLYPVDRLRALGPNAFPRTDSRPSAAGYRELACAVLEAVGGPELPTVEELGMHEAFVVGDLGARFHPGLGEVVARPAAGTAAPPPDPRVCLIFGEPASDELPGHGIAWWLGLAFGEVHVIPDALGWDQERLMALRPGVVVAECAEEQCAIAPVAAPRPEGPSRITISERSPLVSIITPSLNQGRFIETALRSVAAQDYPAIEHIVVDGVSSDDTAAVVASFGDSVRWICEPDSGQAQAINNGIARSRGKIVTWVNADDALLEGAVGRGVATLLRHPEASFVHGGAIITGPDGDESAVFQPPPMLDHDSLRIENHVMQPAAFFTRARWDEVGGLREDLHWTLDWDLFLKLARRGPIARVDGAPLARACLHPDSKTVSGGWRRYREILHMLRDHGVDRRAVAAYGLELVDRWMIDAASAAGRPVSRSDVLLSRGPLAGLRSSVSGRFWPPAVFGDNWVSTIADVRLASGRGDVIVEGAVPEWAPLGDQVLTIEVTGEEPVRLPVGEGSFAVRCPAAASGPVRVRVRADRSYVPAKHLAGSVDRRRLAWMYSSIRREG